jgi:hypothetical protein
VLARLTRRRRARIWISEWSGQTKKEQNYDSSRATYCKWRGDDRSLPAEDGRQEKGMR